MTFSDYLNSDDCTWHVGAFILGLIFLCFTAAFVLLP